MDNSYWIVFFVQRDIIPIPIREYFVVLNTVELIGDILAVIVGSFGIYVFYKVQYFHFNLAAIWVNSFLIGIFFVISRYILIPFEYGYLNNTGIGNLIIVHVSTYRFILWIALFHFEILITMERICALYFASTYEKIPRRFISAIIIMTNYAISSMLGYLVVHKIVHGFYYLVFVCVAGNISYMTFLYLNQAGRRQQKKLLEKYRGYSVSYRWQLQQNIASAEQLSILMIIVNIATSVILPSIFVPALILENDESMKEIYEVAKLFMQLMVSLSFALVYGIFLIAVSKHREWMCGKKTVTDAERYQQRIEKMSVDAHLSRLEETWNAKGMNQSHWILFFVQKDSLPEPFKSNFYLYTSIELIADTVSICVAIFAIFVFHKVQFFHFNLAAIFINAYIIGPIYIISRYILVPFEYGYSKNSSMANYVIVFVSTFRFALWIALYHFVILIAIERRFALHFVTTYEKIPRHSISIVIIVLNYFISSLLSYLVVNKILHGFYYLAFLFIANNTAYVTFLYLNRAGKQQQKELLEQYKGYSVSYRWQLQQNISAAEQLSILMIIINITICLILPCIFITANILDNDENMKEIYEVSKLFLQLLISLVFPLVYSIVLLAISKHREWLFGNNKTSEDDRHQKRIEKLTIDAHLSQLEDAWNAKLDNKRNL